MRAMASPSRSPASGARGWPKRALGLAVLLLVTGAGAARAEDPAPKPKEPPAPNAPGGAKEPAPAGAKEKDDPYPPEFRARVNAAVDRGVERLLKRQNEDGSWPAEGTGLASQRLGVCALMTLACLMGGTPGDHPRLTHAFGYMRTLPVEKTYSVGVLLMALHARYAGVEDAFSQDGTDAYGNPVRKDPCVTRMSPGDKAWMEEAVAYLLKHQNAGTWRYPEQGYDLSNTQYALLGLWAAARCGAKVPLEAWMTALEALLAAQERTGPEVKLRTTEARGDYRVVVTEDARARGFRYRPEDPLTGAMTTAGLAGLAICQDELWASRRFTAELRTRTRKGIRDALAWLQESFDVGKNPGLPGGGWHFYWLYGLERAGMLARTRFIGTRDWYLEGATWLLGQQRDDGSWSNEHTLLDTAFAVLFLKRAAMRSRQPAITPSEPAPR
jgi:hypothetical protein